MPPRTFLCSSSAVSSTVSLWVSSLLRFQSTFLSWPRLRSVGELLVSSSGPSLGVSLSCTSKYTARLAPSIQYLTDHSISYGASFVSGNTADTIDVASFRIPWGLQMIPAVFLFLAMFILPESPRWLARKDRWEDCHNILTKVHGKGDPNHPFVAHELEDIRAMAEFEAQNADVTYWELFSPKYINRTQIGLWTQVWSQLTGMNVMMYYIAYIFTMVRFDICTFRIRMR